MCAADPVGRQEHYSSFRSAPALETERLILRQFEAADFDAHVEVMRDPEVCRYLGPPQSREDIWRRALSWVGMWEVRGFGGWMAVRKADDALVGHVGLFDAKRDLSTDMGDTPEMGWIFARSVHGQGIAREACDAVLRWSASKLAPTPLWAMISPENAASLRLAERLGFDRLCDDRYRGEPVLLMQRSISSG